MNAILTYLLLRALIIGPPIIATVALCLLVEAWPAAGAFPGANGVIVAGRCDDGASCRAQHLWTVDARSGARLQLTSGSDRDEDPSFSPDGRRIVFNRCPPGGHCRIAAIDVTGANETDLRHGHSSGHDELPSFSPDGSRIVFTKTERNGRHLYVMDANGHDVTRLTRGRAQDRGAVFSPNGTSIVFERYVSGVGFRIYQTAANGGAPVPLTSGPGDYSPSISPDGSRIVFGRRAGAGSAIWIRAADGGGEHALTTPRAGSSDAQPAFSPDGNQIVFDRLVGGPPAGEPLLVIDAGGRGERAITPAAEFFYNADWQPLHSNRAEFAERCSTRLAATTRVDTLTGTAGPDLIDGRAGNDRIRGGAGDDCLNGGKGRDRISGAVGDDVLTGGRGNDVLGSGAGKDKLAGGPGDDALNAADGSKDIARCGPGNDTVRADAADRLSGCEQVMRAETR